MTIESIKNQLPDFAKDIKLNLGVILSEEGATDLKLKQIYAIALASAYATKEAKLFQVLHALAEVYLTPEELLAIKGAATIMAMNNIYYRFTHSIADTAYSSMPAKLRMNMMANPGIDKMTFELASLAVSAINGCGMCMNAHTLQIEKHQISKQGVQSAIRIAAVINATAMGIKIASE